MSFFSRTTHPSSIKLDKKHPWVEVCSNKMPHPFPRGYKSDIQWKNIDNFWKSSLELSIIKTKLAQTSLDGWNSLFYKWGTILFSKGRLQILGYFFFFLNLPLCWSNHTYGQVYLLLGNVSGEQCGPWASCLNIFIQFFFWLLQ